MGYSMVIKSGEAVSTSSASATHLLQAGSDRWYIAVLLGIPLGVLAAMKHDST